MARSRLFAFIAALGALSLGSAPALSQIDSVDPDMAMQSPAASDVSDADYGGYGSETDTGDSGGDYGWDAGAATEADTTIAADPAYIPPDTPGNETGADYGTSETYDYGNYGSDDPYQGSAGTDVATTATNPAAPAGSETTYQRDDLIAAAGGLFGDGAEGLARMIENILEEQGEPNGYIIGREAGGAFIFGLRYGSGTLFHRVEGEQPVYWTGPSIGFDVGANGASTFVLVYNLYDTNELFQRFPAVEGDAYFIGGVTASYLRSGDKVLIPIRVGAGLRLGANIGYMNFSRNRRWLPF